MIIKINKNVKNDILPEKILLDEKTNSFKNPIYDYLNNKYQNELLQMDNNDLYTLFKKKVFSDVDLSLYVLTFNRLQVRPKSIKTVCQTLRRFDEIGLCNDLFDIFERLTDDKSKLDSIDCIILNASTVDVGVLYEELYYDKLTNNLTL